MSLGKLQDKIAQNKSRIIQIDEILTTAGFETPDQAQALRLEKQVLQDEIPLLERELIKIKAVQREEDLKKVMGQLTSLVKKSRALEVKMYTTLIEIMKDATSLGAMRQEYYKMIARFPELENQPDLSFPSHAFEDPVITKIAESDTPRPSAATWEKIEKQWLEARRKFHYPES